MVANSSNGQVVVDMRNTDLGFSVEQGLDYSAITVILPDSRVMNLEKWLPELAAVLQTTPARLQEGFTLYPFMAPATGTVTQFQPVCPRFCDMLPHGDGTYSCFCG